MNANEMIKIISKVWCTNEDLQKLSGLGITNTSKLKRKLKEELEKDGKVLPKGLLPMSEVVKYLNIDIDYYKKIAEYQLKEQVVVFLDEDITAITHGIFDHR